LSLPDYRIGPQPLKDPEDQKWKSIHFTAAL
jgi:hypothetical protein